MLHVVHHPDYVAPPAPDGRFTFDKYARVMGALDEALVAYEIHTPARMPRHWIEAVHDPAYVAEVLACAVPREKERRIGFPVTPHNVGRAQLAPGGTWLAAHLALRHGYAANAAGGSHHALHDTGAGYCVFNDLAIAANRLVAEGSVRRILVVDCDVHQGDGTAALMAGRADVVTFSIHAEKNFPVRKAASDCDVALADGTVDDAYLSALAAHLPSLIDSVTPDLILYQAGVDPHRDDRLGRLALSDAGLEARDRFVVRQSLSRGVAVASALGGGYGADGWAVARRHAASILACADEAARCGNGRAFSA
ncbi:histone deacetylase [Sphingomonas sp.]|uniref:histone deacetylase family protein n=1 Tax=Sphingomonas sp. TaxID=28214 RepID=UPI003B00D540